MTQYIEMKISSTIFNIIRENEAPLWTVSAYAGAVLHVSDEFC